LEKHIHQAIPSWLLSRTTLTTHSENNHEYFGIRRVWTQSQPHAFNARFLLYFHSKGITHHKFTAQEPRDPWGKHLFDTVITPWEKVLDLFHHNRGIDKIGYSYSPEGFIWYNFWWVRSTYVRRLEEPVVTADRYYYERYLALLPRRKGGNLLFSNDHYFLNSTNCKGLEVATPWTNS
jgi:hypothetical protein